MNIDNPGNVSALHVPEGLIEFQKHHRIELLVHIMATVLQTVHRIWFDLIGNMRSKSSPDLVDVSEKKSGQHKFSERFGTLLKLPQCAVAPSAR